MRPRVRMGIGILVLALATSGCYGSFNLTRRLYRWNGQTSDKWEREFLFLLLTWAPVYGVAGLGDAIVFNAIEFWTGKNPVEPPGKARGRGGHATRLSRGDHEALLTYMRGPDGVALLIEQFQQDHPGARLLLVHRDGMTIGSDGDGQTLFTAQSLPDGSVLICDKEGRPLAIYPQERAVRFLTSASRMASLR